MNWEDLEKHFSSARLGRYRASCDGDKEIATRAYVSNLLLAEAMMPLLNVLEIALRNCMHNRLALLYERADWWHDWIGRPVFDWQIREVNNAKAKLLRRAEVATPDKIVAELAFGFWSSLLNAQFQGILWKELRLVFPRCPKQKRQRHTISAALNQVRSLRNRVFHHEQLLWLTPTLIALHARGMEVVGWLDPSLQNWLAQLDRLPAVWDSAQPI